MFSKSISPLLKKNKNTNVSLIQLSCDPDVDRLLCKIQRQNKQLSENRDFKGLRKCVLSREKECRSVNPHCLLDIGLYRNMTSLTK